MAQYCYNYVLKVLETSRPILAQLAEKYPLVLVSNFYGNIETILADFRLQYFQHIVESAVVGVRKPDPQIYQLGIDALRKVTGKTEEELPTNDILVVGDSFSKDIIPATQLGCKTVWVKGVGWGKEEVDETVPTYIIYNIKDLPETISKG